MNSAVQVEQQQLTPQFKFGMSFTHCKKIELKDELEGNQCFSELAGDICSQGTHVQHKISYYRYQCVLFALVDDSF